MSRIASRFYFKCNEKRQLGQYIDCTHTNTQREMENLWLENGHPDGPYSSS